MRIDIMRIEIMRIEESRSKASEGGRHLAANPIFFDFFGL